MEENKPFQYITFGDCLQLCRYMNLTEQDQGMVVISAPKGSKLTIG